MKYYENIGKYLENAFNVTEFFYQGNRIAKTSAGIWVKFDKDMIR